MQSLIAPGAQSATQAFYISQARVAHLVGYVNTFTIEPLTVDIAAEVDDHVAGSRVFHPDCADLANAAR